MPRNVSRPGDYKLKSVVDIFSGHGLDLTQIRPESMAPAIATERKVCEAESWTFERLDLVRLQRNSSLVPQLPCLASELFKFVRTVLSLASSPSAALFTGSWEPLALSLYRSKLERDTHVYISGHGPAVP